MAQNTIACTYIYKLKYNNNISFRFLSVAFIFLFFLILMSFRHQTIFYNSSFSFSLVSKYTIYSNVTFISSLALSISRVRTLFPFYTLITSSTSFQLWYIQNSYKDSRYEAIKFRYTYIRPEILYSIVIIVFIYLFVRLLFSQYHENCSVSGDLTHIFENFTIFYFVEMNILLCVPQRIADSK